MWSFSLIDEKFAFGMIAKSALDVFAVGFRIKSIYPCTDIDISFCQYVKCNENKIEPKEKCHHKIKNLRKLNHPSIRNILFCKINQTNIQK